VQSVPPGSVNPGYGAKQKRLKQYAIPSKTIANALINCHLQGGFASSLVPDSPPRRGLCPWWTPDPHYVCMHFNTLISLANNLFTFFGDSVVAYYLRLLYGSFSFSFVNWKMLHHILSHLPPYSHWFPVLLLAWLLLCGVEWCDVSACPREVRTMRSASWMPVVSGQLTSTALFCADFRRWNLMIRLHSSVRWADASLNRSTLYSLQ